MIAANFTKTPVSLALKALVGRLGVDRGHRVSVQDALKEMLIDYFTKHGEAPPAELTETGEPAPAPPAAPIRKTAGPRSSRNNPKPSALYPDASGVAAARPGATENRLDQLLASLPDSRAERPRPRPGPSLTGLW